MSGYILGTALLAKGIVEGNSWEQLAGITLMNDASAANNQQQQRELQLREREMRLAWCENRAVLGLASIQV